MGRILTHGRISPKTSVCLKVVKEKLCGIKTVWVVWPGWMKSGKTAGFYSAVQKQLSLKKCVWVQTSIPH